MHTFSGLNQDSIASILALIGGVSSVVIFLRNQFIQTRETMLARYDAMNDAYIEYQRMCLENPELETSWYFLGKEGGSESDQDPVAKVKKNILFDIMTSMFERSYLTYLHAPSKIRTSQWPGWKAFIEYFVGRDDYREWWCANVIDFSTSKWIDGYSQYDIRFEKFMKTLLTA